MQSFRECKAACEIVHFSKVADCSPATLLNLNACTIFRTPYSVPEADLGLSQLLRRSSLWHYLMAGSC